MTQIVLVFFKDMSTYLSSSTVATVTEAHEDVCNKLDHIDYHNKMEKFDCLLKNIDTNIEKLCHLFQLKIKLQYLNHLKMLHRSGLGDCWDQFLINNPSALDSCFNRDRRFLPSVFDVPFVVPDNMKDVDEFFKNY